MLQCIFTILLPRTNFIDRTHAQEIAIWAYYKFRQAVCLCCRQWAELIHNTPEAWSTLICTLGDPMFSLNYIKLALERSGSARLHISVVFPDHEDGPISQGAIMNFMVVLRPALPRCYSLDICGQLSQLVAFDTLAAIKQLRLILFRDPQVPAPPLEPEFTLPSISPLSLHIEVGEHAISSLLLDRLDPSELISLELDASCISDQLLRVLRASSKLRSLRVFLSDPTPIPAGVRLDHLKSLRIDGNLGSMPHLLHAPSLESLTIECDMGETPLHAAMWLKILTVYPKLRTLTLDHTIGTNDVLLSIVRDTKSLKNLTVRRILPPTAANSRLFAGILDQLNNQDLKTRSEGPRHLRRLHIQYGFEVSEESTVGASLRRLLIQAPELTVIAWAYGWGALGSDWRRDMLEEFENFRASQ